MNVTRSPSRRGANQPEKETTWYRDRTQSQRFYYIPGEPTPELAPNGVPTLSLWVTDRDARLQVGVEWKLDQNQLAQLRRSIASQYPSLAASSIDLQPAPARVEEVHLLVRNKEGTLESLARATSSGFPPYTTLFAVTLDNEQKNHAVSALHGRSGYVALRYSIVATNEEGRTEAIERTADLADWFASRRGSDHIRVVPGTSLVPVPTSGQPPPPPPSTHLRIGLEEGLKEAPIAFIRLEQGSSNLFLRPPVFEPVEMPATVAPIRCTTQYTVGRPYSSELSNFAADQPVLLGASETGLAEIILSAPNWQATKAREVRVQVRYLPAGDGSDDDSTVYLRGDKWQERWWVITRHSTLNGELEITAKITEANGNIQTPPRYRQSTGEIVIL